MSEVTFLVGLSYKWCSSGLSVWATVGLAALLRVDGFQGRLEPHLEEYTRLQHLVTRLQHLASRLQHLATRPEQSAAVAREVAKRNSTGTSVKKLGWIRVKTV